MSKESLPDDVILIRKAEPPAKMVQGGKREQKPIPYEDFPAREWEDPFLAAYSVNPNIGHACEVAGITRTKFLDWKRKCKRFAEEVENAHQDGLDTIEYHMMQRAKDKDTLAGIFILKNQRPHIYGDKQPVRMNAPVSFTLQIGGPVGNQDVPKQVGAGATITATPVATTKPVKDAPTDD